MLKINQKLLIVFFVLFFLSCGGGIFLLAQQSLSDAGFVYDPQGKRNPFIPLVSSDGRMINLEKDQKQRGDLSVEGIIFDKNGRSYAIVNAQVVEIGDKILDYQVLKIEGDKVLFIKDGVITQIELKKEEE